MSKELKILHIGNGKAYKIKAIVDAFLRQGHEVHMVPIPPIQGNWEGVTWHSLLPLPFPGKLKVIVRLFQVRRLARNLKPDIVHAHNAMGPGWYGTFTGLHPLIIQGYGGDLLPERHRERSILQQQLTAWTCRSADRIIVTGKHMIEAVTRFGISRERVMLLSRGVNLERFRPGLDTTELRQRLNLNMANPLILSSRYQVNETLYNLDTVIDAFAMVRKRFPRAVCLQLFDPQQKAGRTRLEKIAEERKLNNNYRLVPAVDNEIMPQFYNLADAVVSVPSTDGFPVTVLEASACGVPLVVSKLPYCKEWFVNGENGLVVPARDPNALAEALCVICSDDQLRRKIVRAGRRKVEENADYRRSMEALESVYHDLLKK